MKKTLLGLLALTSISAFAGPKVEIKCFTDYHVLARYKAVQVGDIAARAIERQQDSFIINFETNNRNVHELDIMGRTIGVKTDLILDSAQAGGPSDFIEAVELSIANFETGEWSEVIAPLSAKMVTSTASLRDQPGILPKEISRNYFWSVSCRW